MIGRLALIGILTAAAVVGSAQQFNWLRDANGRNMEFVQQGGAASAYSAFEGSSYGKTWVDCTSWTLLTGGMIEAVVALEPGGQSTPPPSLREYWIHTADTFDDAKNNVIGQTVQLGSALSEALLSFTTGEGYAEYLVRWTIPSTIANKFVTVAEHQTLGALLGYSKITQGTSSLYPTDFSTLSGNFGTSDPFPNANISLGNPVPEPATIAPFGIGVVALLRRRRNHSSTQSGAAGATR